MKMEFEVVVDEVNPVVLLRMGDEERVLKAGEWSDWLPVAFDPAPVVGSVKGMVQVYVKSVDPYLTLYVSPLNLDPTAPAQPFATPGFAEQVAKAVGRFHTIGIPEDSKCLEAGVMTDDEYLVLIENVFRERKRILDYALSEYQSGFLFVYFGTIDQTSHSFFRTMEEDAPPEVKRLANVIPDTYAKIDKVIGEVVDRAGPNGNVMVMSDHGFAHYRTKVNLNTWLAQQGLLTTKVPKKGDRSPMAHIDWSRTKAYALGLNLLYVNTQGREPNGTVPAAERSKMVAELKEKLLGWTDERNGNHVVTRVTVPGESPYPDRTPDIIVGYARTYRSSDASAVGQVPSEIFEENRDRWRGDHCMDPDLVPGVVASTLKLDTSQGPSLVDLGPTILDYFQVPQPGKVAGKSLLRHGD
jgi:predicted AlkP superfamily phosphohydrolase/phosphomutase